VRETAWPRSRTSASDPRAWVLDSAEPAARWIVLTRVLDRADDDADVAAARAGVLADEGTRELLDRLGDWESGEPFSGHDSPRFAPNQLNLLADMGLRAGDDPRIDHLVGRMLAHQDDSGRFPSFAPGRAGTPPVWGALLCDSHAALEVAVRFGRAGDARVLSGLTRVLADVTATPQGSAWPCLPHPVSGFRGPGRKADCCPQVTVEALRLFARLPPERRPAGLLAPARTALGAWRRRGVDRPYMFGHGQTFKTVKWPSTWYRVDSVLEALAGYPGLWRGPGADPEDRRALAELAACLVAYNVGADGLVVPRSTYRGFESFSFGTKKEPSPFATARLLAILHPYADLADAISAVDVTALSSAKGGSGLARPPRG
jgi:hypothetical protein